MEGPPTGRRSLIDKGRRDRDGQKQRQSRCCWPLAATTAHITLNHDPAAPHASRGGGRQGGRGHDSCAGGRFSAQRWALHRGRSPAASLNLLALLWHCFWRATASAGRVRSQDKGTKGRSRADALSSQRGLVDYSSRSLPQPDSITPGVVSQARRQIQSIAGRIIQRRAVAARYCCRYALARAGAILCGGAGVVGGFSCADHPGSLSPAAHNFCHKQACTGRQGAS